MLTTEEAQHLTGVNVRTLFQWVEAARIHFLEDANGSLLICLAPLGIDVVLQSAAVDADHKRVSE
jgi:hypothetical protein